MAQSGAALFFASEILRDPGFNVAYWNLHERPLTGDEHGHFTIAGAHPLVLFHFSFFNPDCLEVLAQKGSTFEPVKSESVRALTRDYAQRLERNGRAACRTLPYRYGHFTDGTPVTDGHREYYRIRLCQTPKSEGDPFDPRFRVPGGEGLKSLYRANHPLTLLIRRIRRVRQAVLGPDRYDF